MGFGDTITSLIFQLILHTYRIIQPKLLMLVIQYSLYPLGQMEID